MISILSFLIFFDISYSATFIYSTADIGKKTRNNCSTEKNYYARALCFIDKSKNSAQKDFFKTTGINRCSDIYAVIGNAVVQSESTTSDFLSKISNAQVQCQNAMERNIDNITKGIQKQIALLFVNGDDSDISKYDVVYELSKAEAMIVNSVNVNKKSNPIRILPGNIKFDCAVNNNFFSICPKITLKYYDKDNRKERENSILGHVIFMRKAIAEIVKYSLMVKMVPGFPFIPTVAKKNNTIFGVSVQLDFVPVPLPSDYKKERDLKGPLNLPNLKAPLSELAGGSDSDKGNKNTSDVMSTALKITNVSESCVYMGSGIKILHCFKSYNVDSDNKDAAQYVISEATPQNNVLPQPPKNMSTLLNLKELHKDITQAIQDTQQNTAKTTDMFNAIDTYSDQIKDQMIKVNTLIQEISEGFKSIESALKSWCNKDNSICD